MRHVTFVLFAGLALAAGCSSVPGDPAEPVFSAQLFSAQSARIDNAYFPLVPGTVHVYTSESADGVEIVVVEVLATTRVVAGVECAVVRDRVWIDDLLIEDTYDWYAQDRAGNVWYMGEDVTNYEYDDEGNVIATDSAGAWEAGRDVAGVGSTASPGFLMKATLVVGDAYQQEFYRGEAEDRARIVARDVPVTLADGSRYICVQTLDDTPLEAGSAERKYYAPGVGLVLVEKADGSSRDELRGWFDLGAASLPDFAGASFSNPTAITNPYLPFPPETARMFVDAGGDEVEVIVVEVLTETRFIAGVECVVVRDRVYVDDLLVEDTRDWYAQDDAGNVWYMGEDVTNYEYDDDGNLVGTDPGGSWEAGVDGAEAGILMWAAPARGASYYQEFYPGEAEDMAVVVRTGVTVTLSDGRSFTDCVQVLERTHLEPHAHEFKVYAPGVGVVLEAPLDGSPPVEALGGFDTSLGSLPDFGAASFSDPSTLTNPFFPLAAGAAYEYEVETDEGTERILVEVLGTRTVNGVSCRVVRDRVFLDGLLIEDTFDWFAQDDAGNVWYMGEDVTNFEHDDQGNVIGTDSEGAWEAGVDGALPGILMFAAPVVGRSHRQEFYEGEAEDMAVPVATGVTVVLADGTTYTGCLQTFEWTPLDPSAVEYKFYAPGIGPVAEQKVGGAERLELVSGP